MLQPTPSLVRRPAFATTLFRFRARGIQSLKIIPPIQKEG
jgi:hypothetical protein